ncbi:nuclear transport factor 2 family protein [Actinoplanes sp. NPDC051851]|uniref:nuclear transport factor 2 family protein n=1 Tax=Actinoplanes sp. NPDC051851 TaxID=3154753 RepID=UPI00343A79B5
MSVYGEAERMVRRMCEAASAGDLTAIDELFAADLYSHPLGAWGLDAIRDVWSRTHARYPQLRITPEEILATGDRVAVRASVRTSPDAEPATLMEFWRLRDGRIAELWGLSTLR